jgi:predicted enzyme related to lactoylglutathione lyase
VHGDLSFFELGVADTERGRTFYKGLFGWEFQPGPSEDGCEIPTPGISGGMHGGDPDAGPYVLLEVDDMEAAIARVRHLGGRVDEADIEGGEDDIARFGRFMLCVDDQGSPFGLHQPPK